MREYKVNRAWHKVFEYDDEIPGDLIVLSDWKKGNIGDWVMADDGCVIQILRKGSMYRTKDKNREYVGTCTGTFAITKHSKMDTSKRKNIYSFSGEKTPRDILNDREKLTANETLFLLNYAKGMNPREAYLKAFPTNDLQYAQKKSAELVKTKRINTKMKEELKPVFEGLDIDENWILKNIKEVIQSSEKDETRLKALFKLSDIMDLEDKNKTTVTQISGAVFKGFSEDDALKAVRPEDPKKISG